ncbi:HCP-like protein [Trichoderma citrinoviride]|uniref:HCP-like protein n=1 Tax=Trichoderma citrinoviride TaxID=58853 RepID=A0A2T4BMJ5_9HYPO|nr:HCP-like protein [Trichoderma citrinoviride]PTB70544.1 HCP-like protein [Trichoderma citrinoviride]
MPPEGQRGANYPPRGGMGPGNRGRPNMPRGGGPGPGPGKPFPILPLHSSPDFPRPPPNQYGAQRSMTMPNSVPAGRGMPQRPATTTGNRPPPQRTYPQDAQGPPQRQYSNAGGQGPVPNGYGSNGYGPGPGQQGDNGYGAPSYNKAVDDLYDSYYDEPSTNATHLNPQQDSRMLQTHARQESRSSMPDFDAIPADSKRDSFEQSMRPGNEQPQQGAHQMPKLGHARSMVELREPQSAVFEMTSDIPEVPAIPQTHAYQQQQPQGYGQTGYGYSQPPIPPGPSAPPGPAGQHPGFANGRPPIVRPGTAAPANPDSLPAHPTPVRPGLMENSPVNPNAKPPPVRNYGGGPQVGQQPQARHSGQSQHSDQQPYPQQAPPPVRPKEKEPPVTPAELEHLRMVIKGNPNDQASALKLAKRLIEASDVLWYKRAATLGDPPAMYKVGMILLKGLLGQPKNPREAVGWLKRAAERADAENPHALHELGLLYESAQPNDVIIRDEQYALSLFQQAAEIGYKFSQFRLGCAYEYGLLGCPIDPRLSIVWYSRAAQQEEHQSELALSGWYLTGSEGVLGQSDTEAYLWARKAAVAGLAKAEYAMGYFTEVGIGVPANLEDAKRWYWRAAAQDFPKARERLEDLKRSGKEKARPRERISRSRIEKQDGDCVLM